MTLDLRHQVGTYTIEIECGAVIENLLRQAKALGYTVEFKEYCEDAETPGLLGQFAGVCLAHRKAIKIRTAKRTAAQIVATLEHELEHAAGAEWASDRPEHGLFCGGTRK